MPTSVVFGHLLASLLTQVFVAAYDAADGSGKWAVDGGGTGMEVHLPTPPDTSRWYMCMHMCMCMYPSLTRCSLAYGEELLTTKNCDLPRESA